MREYITCTVKNTSSAYVDTNQAGYNKEGGESTLYQSEPCFRQIRRSDPPKCLFKSGIV